ncbi:MAG: NAD(P)/FAD-dependent oxidoreductase [Candidatus Omnitrophica bacterium]|nr:NAD(P)/FAD-dependent oxidoreductase [Candidatus Omnitrophota bacterium]
MKIYDVIIIGAGVVGTAIARELSRYELKTAVLEKEIEPAFGVSKSNSGIIHPGTQNHCNSLKGRLCVEGNKLMRGIAHELGVDFKEVGELIVVFNKKDIPRLIKLKEEAEKLGVPKIQIVGRGWLKEHEPNLSKKAIAALYAPTAGILSPYRLVYDMIENAQNNGVEVYAQQEVIQIKPSKIRGSKKQGYFEIITSSKRKFKTKYIINSAGLFADDISKLAGIDDFKIKPRKGEEFILDKKKEHITNHLLFPLPAKKSKGVLIIKTSAGNPMIGPTACDCVDKYDLSTTDAGLKKVLSSVKRMIPSISHKDIIAYFAGLRPAAGEDFIIRHEDKVPGFINVAGIQSPGLTAAPAIALMACAILRQQGVNLKKKKIFHKTREKTTHLFEMPFSHTEKIIKEDPDYGDIVCRCEMVSAKEIKEAIKRGAKTLDGIKFRTRAQAGRCHGSFCTCRILKILAENSKRPITQITKKGAGSEIVLEKRCND